MGAIELNSTPLISDANLVSYWRFEGNSTDEKGTNTGTDTSITYGAGTGQFGQGATFNGTSSNILLPNTGNSLNLTTFTINAWIKGSNFNTGIFEKQILTNINTAATRGFQFVVYDTVRGYLYDSTGAYINPISASSANDGNWHMVTLTYDGTNAIVYLDANAGTPVNKASAVAYTSTTPYFGKYNGGSVGWYNNVMDDVSVFSRALSATEISNLYNGTWGSSTIPISNLTLLGVS